MRNTCPGEVGLGDITVQSRGHDNIIAVRMRSVDLQRRVVAHTLHVHQHRGACVRPLVDVNAGVIFPPAACDTQKNTISLSLSTLQQGLDWLCLQMKARSTHACGSKVNIESRQSHRQYHRQKTYRNNKKKCVTSIAFILPKLSSPH